MHSSCRILICLAATCHLKVTEQVQIKAAQGLA